MNSPQWFDTGALSREVEAKLVTRLGVAVVGLALLSGCALPDKPSSAEAANLAQSISYFKDKRTGLCFAATQSAVQTEQDSICREIAREIMSTGASR